MDRKIEELIAENEKLKSENEMLEILLSDRVEDLTELMTLIDDMYELQIVSKRIKESLKVAGLEKQEVESYDTELDLD